MPYDLPPKPEPVPLVQNEVSQIQSPEISQESKAFIQSLEGSKIEPIGIQFFDHKDNICNLTKFTRKNGTSIYITLEHCMRFANQTNLANLKSISFKTIIRFNPRLKAPASDGLIYYEASEFEKWQIQAKNVAQVGSLKGYMNPTQQKILETVRFSNTCEVKDSKESVLISTMRRIKKLRLEQNINNNGLNNFDNSKVKSPSLYDALSPQKGDSAGFIARIGEDINRESCLKIEGFIQSGLFDNKDKFIESVGLQIVNQILKTNISNIQELSPQQQTQLKKELKMSQIDEKLIAKKYIFEIVKSLQNNGYFRDNNKLLDMFVNQVNMYTIDGKSIKAQRQGLLNVTTENGNLKLKIPDFKINTGEIVKPSA